MSRYPRGNWFGVTATATATAGTSQILGRCGLQGVGNYRVSGEYATKVRLVWCMGFYF